MISGSQEMIRDIKRRLVLEKIVNNGPISRAALAKALHLTKATISNIVQELLDQKLVTEIGSGDTAMGRKPIMLAFPQDSGHALAVNIGVDQITLLTSDLKGQNCAVREYPFPQREPLLKYLTRVLHSTIDSLPATTHGVVGISIAIYGVVYQNTLLFTPYYKMPQPDLCSLLEEEFGIPVKAENEANLSVLGESAFHFNYQDMIMINVHDGIGMGILIQGHLYTGHNGYAGEFGHTILYPNGKLCPCGNRGCIEQYASETAILKEYARRRYLPSITLDDFLYAYRSNEPVALDMMDLFVQYMSIAINNVQNTFNADLIVLNSAFTNYIPDLIQRIQNSLGTMQNRDCRVILSQLQDISGLIGGVRISVENFLEIEHLKIDAATLGTR